MEQNTISLSEIIQLMKEVKQNTDNFIEDLKSSLYLEKNGKLVNPKFIHIRFLDNSFYTLTIDGCPFRLDSNGVATFYLMSFNEDKEVEGQKILNRNSYVITNALKHLHSNSPKYFVVFTNVKGYMNFEDVIGETQVRVNCNKVSVSSRNFAQLTINYNIKDDNITLGSEANEISIDSIAEILGDKIDVEKIYMEINEFLKNTLISTEKLPLVLKNQMESKHNPRKL